MRTHAPPRSCFFYDSRYARGIYPYKYLVHITSSVSLTARLIYHIRRGLSSDLMKIFEKNFLYPAASERIVRAFRAHLPLRGDGSYIIPLTRAKSQVFFRKKY